MVESLCHPDKSHWCIQCCSERDCCLLGTLPDGSRGCQGHHTSQKNSDIPETPLCQAFDCLTLTGHSSENEREQIRTIIEGLPKGEFVMSQVLSILE